MQYALTFHIIGLAMWLPGLMVVTGILRYFVKCEGAVPKAGRDLSRRYWFALVLPGFALSVLSGLHQLFATGVGIYMKQGWFHGKLTLIVLLLVVTAGVGMTLREESPPSVKKLTVLHSISGSLLLFIVALTMIGRAAG